MATAIHGYQIKDLTVSGADIASNTLTEDKFYIVNDPIGGFFVHGQKIHLSLQRRGDKR